MTRTHPALHLLVARPRFEQIRIRHLPKKHLGHAEGAGRCRVLSKDDEKVLLMQVAVEIALLEQSGCQIHVLEYGERDRLLRLSVRLEPYRLRLDARFLELGNLGILFDTEDVLSDPGAEVLGLVLSRTRLVKQAEMPGKVIFGQAHIGFEAQTHQFGEPKVAVAFLTGNGLGVQKIVERRRHVRGFDSPRTGLGGNWRERLRPSVLARCGLRTRLEVERVRSRELVCAPRPNLPYDGLPVTLEDGGVLRGHAPELDQHDEVIRRIQVLIVQICDEQQLVQLLLQRARLPGLINHAHVVDHLDDQPLLGGETTVFATLETRGLEFCMDLLEIGVGVAVVGDAEIALLDRIPQRALSLGEAFDEIDAALLSQRRALKLLGIGIDRIKR